MSKPSKDVCAKIHALAEIAIQRYARGILTVDALVMRMVSEWEGVQEEDEQPLQRVLWRIAQRICSQELCNAWRSNDTTIRDQAFFNLKEYLTVSLRYTPYVKALRHYANAVDDVVYQTLEELHKLLLRHGKVGPDDPAAFLKWVQIILNRKAYVMLERLKRDEHHSLEEEMEHAPERFVNESSRDMLAEVLQEEQGQVLAGVLAAIRNERYRQVLLYTYVEELDEAEIAERMGTTIQNIYVLRSRALKCLRKALEIRNSGVLYTSEQNVIHC